jgi:hypothetical protein
MTETGLLAAARFSDTGLPAAPDTHMSAFKVAARLDGRILTCSGRCLPDLPPFAFRC